MPFPPAIRSRRDSWPPTQVRLNQTLSLEESDHSLDGIDDDPLTYFLTPAPSFDNDDIDVDMMDFDAGIEDLSRAQDIVRSVSPSSLEGGLKRPTGRRLSPDRDVSEAVTPNDEEEEDYIHFGNGGLGLPFHLRDFTIDGIKPKSKGKKAAPNELLRPASFHVSPARGRTPARGHGQGRARSLSARRRPQHLWREPSPDVWSIEEETEEELHSDVDGSMIRSDDEEDTKNDAQMLEVPAAKPIKRVRFVLPVKD